MGKPKKEKQVSKMPEEEKQEQSKRNEPFQFGKTKVDKRFSAMFSDDAFKSNFGRDKFGRPSEHVSSDNIEKYYDLESSGSESETSDEEVEEEKTKLDDISEKLETSESEDGSSSESSTTDDEDDSASEDEEDFDHKWEELDADVSEAKEVTNRLAVCNMDWDRIRAEDILAVCNSFKPSDGIVHSVKIYPSEYGLQRIEEEKLHGPRELVEQPLEDDEDDVVAKNPSGEGSKYHREKLRQYQINRLKYYYAVVDCDSPRTADAIYEQLNGMEYESSAISFDLRFIPNDVTFDLGPKSVAADIPDPTVYKPRLFINSALQQVKVNLTWDETDPTRRETLQKAFREPESLEKDIKNYLASSSSESDSEDETDAHINSDKKSLKLKDRISKYKSLLQSLEDKEEEEKNKYEMEITWNPDLDERANDLVKEKLKQKDASNPFEEKLMKKSMEAKMKKKEKKQQLQKKVESDDEEDFDEDSDDLSSDDHEEKMTREDVDKKKKMVEELALLMGDSQKTEQPKTQQSKKKQKKEAKKKVSEMDKVEVDIEDPRFSALYTSHLYNIDPSDPHYKETKAMKEFIQNKKNKRQHQESLENNSNDQPIAKQSKLSLESRKLVDSVKRKAGFKRSNKRDR